MYMLKKLLYALFELPFAFCRIKSPRLIMTLLVKNEEALLEQNLIFHKKMGVDAFIITDNNSSDSTPDIIRKYTEKGWVVDVINETATNYEQKTWVDRMIWRAKTLFKADWIINADADELWYSPSGNLKHELSNTRCNIIDCEMRSMYPEENKPFYLWSKAVKTVPNPDDYDLSVYSLFERQNKKVIHKAKGYIQISMGNHKVKMLPQQSGNAGIRVYHYNVRGRQPFIEKMINGGKQLEQRNKRHGGRHWKYFYRLYKENKLNEEYDRVIGLNHYDRLCHDGYIYNDSTIPDFFRTHIDS